MGSAKSAAVHRTTPACDRYSTTYLCACSHFGGCYLLAKTVGHDVKRDGQETDSLDVIDTGFGVEERVRFHIPLIIERF